MHFPKPQFRPLPWGYKLLCLALIIVFTVIGLVGLILPIIPGIIFLFLAAWLVTRISRRGAAYIHGQRWFNEHARPIRAAGKLSFADNMRLFLLVSARALVSGVAKATSLLKKTRDSAH